MLHNTRFLLPLTIILKMCLYHSLLFEDEKSSDLLELKLIFAFLITLVTLLERCLQRSNSLLRYTFCLSLNKCLISGVTHSLLLLVITNSTSGTNLSIIV